MSNVCTSGPSLTQEGTGKALLVCGDVEPNPGPCLGGVLPLTLARLALLALLMVGVGDLWLWGAQPAFVWSPPAAAAASYAPGSSLVRPHWRPSVRTSVEGSSLDRPRL